MLFLINVSLQKVDIVMKVSYIIYAKNAIIRKTIIEYMTPTDQFMEMAKALFNVLIMTQKKIFIWINLKIKLLPKLIKKNGYTNLVMKHVKHVAQEEMHINIIAVLVP